MLEYIRKARQSEGGFTLIELLMVIVILGVLAGIVVFAVGGITDKGEVSACKTDLSTVATAEEAYYAVHGNYTTVAGLVPAFLHSAPDTVTANATTGAVTGLAGATRDCSAVTL